jgi:hypothetical protein
VPKPFIKITSGSIASNNPSTTHRYHTHNSRRRRTCVACALLKKKAFWKPQHKKSFFSPHKIHLSDKRTKLSNPPRSPTLDRKKEPTWLKNSWVDLNITKRVGKLKSTHKKEGQIFFFAGVQQHPPVRTIACLNSNSCCILKPVMPAQYVYVCVCVCVCLSLSPLLVSSLSEALPLLTSCLHVFCDKNFVGSRRKAVRGVQR